MPRTHAPEAGATIWQQKTGAGVSCDLALIFSCTRFWQWSEQCSIIYSVPNSGACFRGISLYKLILMEIFSMVRMNGRYDEQDGCDVNLSTSLQQQLLVSVLTSTHKHTQAQIV